jgi:hypothetical protein
VGVPSAGTELHGPKRERTKVRREGLSGGYLVSTRCLLGRIGAHSIKRADWVWEVCLPWQVALEVDRQRPMVAKAEVIEAGSSGSGRNDRKDQGRSK